MDSRTPGNSGASGCTGRHSVPIALLPDLIHAGPIDLRRWQPSDLQAVMSAVSSSLAELRVWMPWAQEPVTTARYAEVLRNFHTAFDAGTEFIFGMFEGEAVVGGCGLHFRQGPGVADIGYWVRTDRHRQGFATAAVSSLTAAAFRHLGDIREIHITMDKANTASARIPARLGYRLLTEEEREILAPGHTGRGLRWVVTRADWSGPRP